MTWAALAVLLTPHSSAAAPRHSHGHGHVELAPEWQNPCGGSFQPLQPEAADGFRTVRPPVRHYLNHLRRTVSTEFRVLNATLRVIDISDIQSWKLRRHAYKFLPALKPNSSVALKRWHRHVQTYVGAFAFLERAQAGYEHARQLPASPTSRELEALLVSARSLLCDIETTINGSYPHGHGHGRLAAVTRPQMEQRLQFRTRRRQEAGHAAAPVEADRIDLKYAKHAYLNFLLSMRRALQRVRRRGEEAAAQLGSSQSEEAANLSLNLRPVDDRSAGESSSSSESDEADASGGRQSGRRPRPRPRKAGAEWP